MAAKAFFHKVKPRYVINCAAHVGSLNYVTRQAADIIVDNSQMLIGMYQAIADVCPAAVVINPIANCVYPAKANSFIEDEMWDGHLHRSVLSYGTTRRLMWSLSECYSMQHGIRTISLVVPNMYGPYDSTNPDKAHALNALISKFVKAEQDFKSEIPVWGTGIAIREWLYAPDFARIVLQVIRNPTMLGLDQPVNIAQNFGLSVRELVEIIRSKFDRKFLVKYDPSMPDGALKKVMDDTRFKKMG
ncbi:MAG: NAD-dependent epimerase/dehydratase family protein [Chitinophagia bacterium]|nr:NAD-dependent epimerase/dehydratase family protein [Chitinophagia bacterium]